MRGYEITSEDVAVIQMCKLHISGNVIPISWFSHIKRKNNKPHTTAIILLSDIVYWHRPVEIRNETTGELLGYRKKFIADKLQRSYKSFADLYGYTKDQVRDALQFLANDIEVIILEFRHPVIKGKKFGNVLYIELNVKKLKELTYKDTLSDLNPIGYRVKTREGIVFKPDTNTENTTENKYNTGAEKELADIPEGYDELFSDEVDTSAKDKALAATIESMQAGALKNEQQLVDLGWLDESLRPYGHAFINAAGEQYKPIKKYHSLWRSELLAWQEMSFTTELITKTVAYMRKEGLTIKSPASVTGTALDRMGDHVVDPNVSQVPIFRASTK